ncbi:DinB family protein [Granulicella arctica]|uniref:DinB family protein n=1 Tax=Granulicella arctica TaxID=940613 RepID=UPI0021E067B4|nr:DinB family protein [Granulicella arctica]
MPLYDLLLPEFDDEIRNTRKVLERLPLEMADYKPHEKSMPLAKLAAHVARMPQFFSLILTTPEMDFSKTSMGPYLGTTREELLDTFDVGAATARAELAETADRAMHENWKLCSGTHNLYTGSRYHAARSLFFNHMVHHRAQLGVYLRLNNLPVPGCYGLSADEK